MESNAGESHCLDLHGAVPAGPVKDGKVDECLSGFPGRFSAWVTGSLGLTSVCPPHPLHSSSLLKYLKVNTIAAYNDKYELKYISKKKQMVDKQGTRIEIEK